MAKRVRVLSNHGVNQFKAGEITKAYREGTKWYPSGERKCVLVWCNSEQRCIWLKAEDVEEVA